MVPVAALGQAEAALTAAGFAVGTHISPGLDHSIDQPGLQLGQDFLTRVLA
jgi:phospholipase/carboxylesterase